MKESNAEGGPRSKEEFIAKSIAEIEAKYGRPIGEVLDAREQILGTIARMLGGDFGMRVSFGEPGSGDRFTGESPEIPKSEWNQIILDPLGLLKEEGWDESTAAHEGGHRAITKTLEQVGLKTKRELDGFASRIGWAGIHNTLEEPAVNDWVSSIYPRIAEILDKDHDRMFERDGEIISSPPVEQMISMLGYIPDFVRYGSEVVRYWHKGSYSSDLTERIRDALSATAPSVRQYYKNIPFAYPTESEVLAKARQRWKTYEKEIWPFVQELIRADMLDEKLKQFLKDQLEKISQEKQEGEQQEKDQGGDSQGQKEQESQKGTGGGSGQSGFDSQGEQGLEELMELFGFSEEEKQEMRERMGQAQSQKEKQKEKLRKELQNGEISKEEFDKKMQDLESSLPLDMKDLSDELKQKIADKLSQASQEEQDRLAQEAKKSLERAEDLVNEGLKGKIAPQEESHEQLRQRLDREAQSDKEKAERLAREALERKRQEDEYKKFLKEQEARRNGWEKSVSRHAHQIDELYKEVEELFQKKRNLRWETGYPSGQRLNMAQVMQYEADPRNYLRLWERKTIPEKRDFRFLLQMDLSGSTNKGEIRDNEFDGTVVFEEVLTALMIYSAIVGFTTGLDRGNVVKVYKSFEEDLNTERERLQAQLSALLTEGAGYTPTLAATKISSEMLKAQSQASGENAHFLIVITDGEPTDTGGGEQGLEILRQENERLASENNQVIIGVGIGPGVNEDYLRRAYGEGRFVYAKNTREFPKVMAALLREIFFQTQKPK